MSAHGVQFNEEEFNKAYKEFNKAGVSKAAFMKGTDSYDFYTKGGADKKTKDAVALMECMECGHKFKKNLSSNTFEVKCPKCGGYDVEVISGDSKDSSDVYTKDPLTKKGEKILAAMKKVYGEEKGEQIFYASKNKGTISGVDSGAGLQGACGGERKFDGKGPRFGQDKKTKDALQEGDHVKINYGVYKGKNGKIKELAPSGQFAWVTVSGIKQGENNPVSYDLSDLIKIGVKDQEIKIIIGEDPVNPSPTKQKVEGNDVIYKEYILKQLPGNGEFEVYAPGGSIVGHAKALELAKLFVDRIVASRVGDE
jgi:transcription antitermination factor NusG/phage FluMu protein Com